MQCYSDIEKGGRTRETILCEMSQNRTNDLTRKWNLKTLIAVGAEFTVEGWVGGGEVMRMGHKVSLRSRNNLKISIL
jgi:hypothetical protein